MKPGGRLVYVTCSVLPEENEDAVASFLGSYDEFAPVGLELAGLPAYQRAIGLQMTPLKTGCDGFYVAVLQRSLGLDVDVLAEVIVVFVVGGSRDRAPPPARFLCASEAGSTRSFSFTMSRCVTAAPYSTGARAAADPAR